MDPLYSEERLVKGSIRRKEGHFLDACKNRPQKQRYGTKGISLI